MKLCFEKVDTNIVLGLERIQRVMDRAGNPQKGFYSVLISGTNGKGSVARIVFDLLSATEKKVGLYSSPHLLDLLERVMIGGECVSSTLLEAMEKEVSRLARDVGVRLTPFEHFTAMAILAFARERVDWVVAEVGMGGRLDATNILDASLSVITGIDLDHSEWLGHGIAQVAREKSGIIKEGKPVVVGDLCQEARNVVMSTAREKKAPIHLYGRDYRAEVSLVSRGGVEFSYCSGSDRKNVEYLMIPALGEHFARNAAVALRVFEILTGTGISNNEGMVRKVLRKSSLPGRGEVITFNGKTRIMDVAHNPQGMAALCRTVIEVMGTDLPIVLFSVLEDKEWETMTETLCSAFGRNRLLFVPLKGEERVVGKRAVVSRFGVSVCREDEMERILVESEDTVLVCGCFAMVRRALGILKEAGAY